MTPIEVEPDADWTETGRRIAGALSIRCRAPWSEVVREIWPSLRAQSAEAFADFLYGFALGRVDAVAGGAFEFLQGVFKK